MTHYTKIIRYGLAGIALAVSAVNGGFVANTHAQEPEVTKPVVIKPVGGGGRDPFKKIEPFRLSSKKVVVAVGTPSIEERIAQYKAQKLAAMNAHMPAPKPTTALLLNEMEIIGISRTPRGYAAIVEATPIKLSYVIYPGERFYDGQLVAIEDNRLVFRRETVLSDGRRTRSVEIKPLRQVRPQSLMSATQAAPASPPVADSEKTSEQPAAAPKPE
ncbi:MAG: hypothetical protein ND895_26280 [Pyrinomonadaceae bacterium]|nr:hypothetical protein [Pyrinomonadaceae bacterium]